MILISRFLWRKNATFAISRHYKRFDVFTEAEANKAAGKYDNTSIDFQVEFYKKEGLTPYSEAKLPITSGMFKISVFGLLCFVEPISPFVKFPYDGLSADVPEGCVIIREHVPISNLFTCLWYNEVDRFTSRDQISFSTVRDKIRAKTDWMPYMFLDCERRNFVVQVIILWTLDNLNNVASKTRYCKNYPKFPVSFSGLFLLLKLQIRFTFWISNFVKEHLNLIIIVFFFKKGLNIQKILGKHLREGFNLKYTLILLRQPINIFLLLLVETSSGRIRDVGKETAPTTSAFDRWVA